jgi:hypothetical protein
MTLFVVPASGSTGGGGGTGGAGGGGGSASGDGGTPDAGGIGAGAGAGAGQGGNATPGKLALHGSSARADSAGNLSLNFSCRGSASCQSKLDLYARTTNGRATRTKRRIRLVTRRLTIAPGATVRVKLKLSKAALKRLDNPSRINATIEIRTTSASQTSRSKRSLTIRTQKNQH